MLKLIAVIALTCVAAASGAVASSPFDEVPKDHWAYNAVMQFECTWSPLVFQDDTNTRPMTRYEFAVVTDKIYEALMNSDEAKLCITSSQLSNLIRLADEFSVILDALGVDSEAMKRNLRSLPLTQSTDIDIEEYPELAEMARNHWAYESMKRLYCLGILEGCTKPYEDQRQRGQIRYGTAIAPF